MPGASVVDGHKPGIFEPWQTAADVAFGNVASGLFDDGSGELPEVQGLACCVGNTTGEAEQDQCVVAVLEEIV